MMRSYQTLISLLFSFVFGVIIAISISNGDRNTSLAAVASLVLLWVPYFLALAGVVHLSWPIVLGIDVVLFLHSLGQVTNMYYSTFWWDKLTHFASGVVLASLVVTVLLVVNHDPTPIKLPSKWILFFVTISLLFLGLLWELMEFSFDSTIGTHMQHGLEDTVNDIISDGAAGLVAGMISVYLVGRESIESLDKYVSDLGLERTLSALQRRFQR
jgi:hypothetical protein